MFELKFRHIKITFDFSFFAIMSLMMLYNNKIYTMGLVACLLHESGHMTIMLLKKININKIIFYGAGIKIIPDKSIEFTHWMTQLSVLLAGSVWNFIIYALFKNSIYSDLRIFSFISAGIGAFNLLPLQFLDGGKILVLTLQKVCNYQSIILLERFLKWINVILIITVILVFSFVGKGNMTLFITLCCLLFSTLS